MNEFDGHVVIVTGGASGIGLGIARAFHDAGSRVTLSDFRQDALDSVRRTFSDTSRLQFIRSDVRDELETDQLVAATVERFGPVSIMIANAGIVPNVSVLTMTSDEWDAAIDTNLKGVFLSCKAAARNMVDHGTAGKIVTISSIARNVGRLGASAYCASKAGVEMFTKVMAMEVAEHGITANCIAPGIIDVPRPVGNAVPEFGEAIDAAIPWGRRGNTEEVASAALFLCSQAATYITGVVLPVDGGAGTGWTHMPYSAPQRES